MTEAYRIIKWAEKHSNFEQKRSGGRWICCPTSFDSLGLKRLTKRGASGAAAFGVYVMLAEVAARMPQPGILANEDHPLSTTDLSDLTGWPVKVIDAALRLLTSPEIGWIDRVPYRPTSGTVPEHSGEPPEPSGSVPSRALARAPAAASSSNLASSAAAGGDARGAASLPDVLAAWERRMARDATASETDKLLRLLVALEEQPVVVEGEAVPPAKFLAAAIGEIQPDARVPFRYLAAIIDRCRKDGDMPGADPVAAKPKFRPALTGEQIAAMNAMEMR